VDELKAPQQNQTLGRIAELLRMAEQNRSAEFLPDSLNVFGLFSDLLLPSSRTVEKMSYGDPLFRMPQQSRIPITADKEYLAETIGMTPIATPVTKAVKTVAPLVKEATSRSSVKFLKPNELKMDWRHGTTEENAANIMKSSVFDPSKGKKSYSYSELGHDAVYLAPGDSWWLDPEKAASGRATEYSKTIKTEVAKNAKIAKIDTADDLKAVARKVGFKEPEELVRALGTEDYGKATMPNYKETLEKLKSVGIDGLYFTKNFDTPDVWERGLPAPDQLAIFNKNVIKPKKEQQTETYEDIMSNPFMQDTTR
jgi:hypothetical protein